MHYRMQKVYSAEIHNDILFLRSDRNGTPGQWCCLLRYFRILFHKCPYDLHSLLHRIRCFKSQLVHPVPAQPQQIRTVYKTRLREAPSAFRRSSLNPAQTPRSCHTLPLSRRWRSFPIPRSDQQSFPPRQAGSESPRSSMTMTSGSSPDAIAISTFTVY